MIIVHIPSNGGVSDKMNKKLSSITVHIVWTFFSEYNDVREPPKIN